MSTLLQTRDLAGLTWLEIDLTLVAHAAPRRAHPLVVLEALFKGVFEAAGLDARAVKQLWHSPGQRVHSLGWQAGTRISVTVQLFGLEATGVSVWQEQLVSRFAPPAQPNFTLAEVSSWRLMRAADLPAGGSTLTLDFLTPVPLPHVPGRPNTALDESGFVRLCQTRLRKLFGREGQLPPAPVLGTADWRYWRTEHRSRSQNGHPMFLNGCIGPLHLSGEQLGDWLPWLALFAAVGLGERLSFGQGRFQLSARASKQTPADAVPLQLRRPFVLDSDKQGAHLGLANANLVVNHEGETALKLPLMRIAYIELHSHCQISTPLLDACAQDGIPVLMAAPGQTPLIIAGQGAEAQRYRALALHHAAWTGLDDAQRARIGARLVDEKLASCTWLVRQRYQAGDHRLIEQIERARRAVACTERLSVVRGWEGWAARHYHRWLQRHMQPLGDFQHRQHHAHSPDPVNSVLNYGYGLLRHRLACGVRLSGLDPWLGILHEANDRHEALVSDLMEPWRPYIDRLVLRSIGLGVIQHDSFDARDGYLRLLPQARQRMVQDFPACWKLPRAAAVPGSLRAFETCSTAMQLRPRRAVLPTGACPKSPQARLMKTPLGEPERYALTTMHVRQYWIAYDISDDRERARVERCISRYGQRLQKSVFHCVLDVRRLSRLQGELEALACRSGTIILTALAEPPQVLSIGKSGLALAEKWAFTFP